MGTTGARDDYFKIDLPASMKHIEDWKEGKDFKIPTLYDMIVGNQRTADWWHNRDHLEWLRKGALVLSQTLDIRVKDGVGLGVPLIRVERMNIKSVGTYHDGADGYAIVGTIAFNEARLPEMQAAAVMAHLLKFMLCAWRHQAGAKGEFDRVCRDKMIEFGIDIDAKGNIAIDVDGQFAGVLGRIGVDVPTELAPPPPREGKATSKVWSCNCQRARVGTKNFFAECPKCGRSFEIGDHVGKWPATSHPQP